MSPNPAAFDTLQAARDLQQAGADQRLAETIAEVIQRRSGDYATRVDLAAELAQLETRLTTKFYVALGLLFAALVAVKFFS